MAKVKLQLSNIMTFEQFNKLLNKEAQKQYAVQEFMDLSATEQDRVRQSVESELTEILQSFTRLNTALNTYNEKKDTAK